MNMTYPDPAETEQDTATEPDWITLLPVQSPEFHNMIPDILATYLETLEPDMTIAFYGCGDLARQLVRCFPGSVSRHRACFFTTSQQDDSEFEGFLKTDVETILKNPPEKIFLLSAHYEKSMLEALEPLDRKSVQTITDFVTNGIEPRHKKAIINQIKKNIEAVKHDLTTLFNPTDRVLCYMAISFGHHIPMFLKSLRNHGYKIVVLTTQDVGLPMPAETMVSDGYVDYLYSSAGAGFLFYELEQLLKIYHFSHIHFFLLHTNGHLIEMVMNKADCPVTVEYDDFMTVLFEDEQYLEKYSRLSGVHPDRLLAQQKFIYTHAAGIIYKDAPETLDFLEEKYNHRPPALFQLPVVNPIYFHQNRRPSKLSEQDGRIHVVFPHGLHLNPLLETFFDHRTLFNTIEILNAQGIHFSIYNSLDATGQGYEDYIRLAETNELFDYHFSVPFYDFLPILSRYDFGWASYDFIHGDRFGYYIKTTMGKKIFSYINAGIPTIVSPELHHMCRYITQNTIGLCAGSDDWPHLEQILAGFDHDDFQIGLEHVRNELDIQKQAQRLASFFDETIQ